MELIIREATQLDYENLCELFAEADKLHRDHLAAIFQEPNGPARDKEFILDLLADQATKIFVADGDGELVGLVQAAVKVTPPMAIFVPRCYVVVDTLMVKEAFRHQGIGQTLMDKVQQWALSKGASEIELNVFAFNEAASDFYQKLGYETISRKMSKSLRAR